MFNWFKYKQEILPEIEIKDNHIIAPVGASKEQIKLAIRIQQAINMLHNIRSYSVPYTPIVEGIDNTLRVLKGRSLKKEKFTHTLPKGVSEFQSGGIVPPPTKRDKVACIMGDTVHTNVTKSIMDTLEKGNSTLPERKFVPVSDEDILKALNKLKREFNNKKEKNMSSMIIQENYEKAKEALTAIKKENDSLFTLPEFSEYVKVNKENKENKNLKEKADHFEALFEKQAVEIARLTIEVNLIEQERAGYDSEIENLREELNYLKRINFSPVSATLNKYCANVCSEAVRVFGHTIQAYVATEEMGELIQALSKDLRGQGNQDNIAEEIADVSIMLEQLKLIYGIDQGQFDKKMYAKLDRLEKRIVECRKK